MNRPGKIKSLIRAACQGRSARSEWTAADERIASDGAEAMRQAYTENQRVPRLNAWRRIMKNRRTKLATAAALAIAILLPLSYGATKLIRRFIAISQLPAINVDWPDRGALSPDGRHFAGITWDSEFVVIDTSTGERRNLGVGFYGPVVWSADGTEIAAKTGGVGEEQRGLFAVSPRTGEARSLLRNLGYFDDWSPDGRQILIVRSGSNASDRAVVLINLENRERTVLAEQTGV